MKVSFKKIVEGLFEISCSCDKEWSEFLDKSTKKYLKRKIFKVKKETIFKKCFKKFTSFIVDKVENDYSLTPAKKPEVEIIKVNKERYEIKITLQESNYTGKDSESATKVVNKSTQNIAKANDLASKVSTNLLDSSIYSSTSVIGKQIVSALTKVGVALAAVGIATPVVVATTGGIVDPTPTPEPEPPTPTKHELLLSIKNENTGSEDDRNIDMLTASKEKGNSPYKIVCKDSITEEVLTNVTYTSSKTENFKIENNAIYVTLRTDEGDCSLGGNVTITAKCSGYEDATIDIELADFNKYKYEITDEGSYRIEEAYVYTYEEEERGEYVIPTKYFYNGKWINEIIVGNKSFVFTDQDYKYIVIFPETNNSITIENSAFGLQDPEKCRYSPAFVYLDNCNIAAIPELENVGYLYNRILSESSFLFLNKNINIEEYKSSFIFNNFEDKGEDFQRDGNIYKKLQKKSTF